jgi:hypothetical protein
MQYFIPCCQHQRRRVALLMRLVREDGGYTNTSCTSPVEPKFLRCELARPPNFFPRWTAHLITASVTSMCQGRNKSWLTKIIHTGFAGTVELISNQSTVTKRWKHVGNHYGKILEINTGIWVFAKWADLKKILFV